MDRKRYGKTSAEHMQLRPEEFSWDKQKELDQKTEAWMNRQPFEYDMSRDPFYQQYKQQYAALGNLAMQDTVGQVSALTGGYANSYAQTAGQQAYQQYMDQLSSMMPDLYSMARGNYDAEGQQLYNEIALLEGQRAQAYSEYQADVNDWYNYLSVLQNQEAAAQSSGTTRTSNDDTDDTARLSDSEYRQWSNLFSNAETEEDRERLKKQLADRGYQADANSLFNAYTTGTSVKNWNGTHDVGSLFKASVMTNREFARRGSASVGGQTYDNYKDYVAGVIENWVNNGIPGSNQKLTDEEAIQLMKDYGVY